MRLTELFENIEEELYETAKRVWARRGNEIVKKYRCTSGKKKGRIVSKASECGNAIDLKKRLQFKKTLNIKGSRMKRKALKTKRVNPVSKRLQHMNKMNETK